MQAYRISQRIIDIQRSIYVANAAAKGFHIRDEESALNVVIQVEPFSAGKIHGSVERPAFRGLVFKARAGHKRLRRGKSQLLYSPGADVFSQYRKRHFLPKFMFHADPCGGSEKLVDLGIEQKVAYRVAGNQRIVFPWASHLQFQSGAQISCTQILLSKRTRFMDCTSAYREPIEKRRS